MGRSAVQNERARDERREEILTAALRLFATRGAGATRMGDIAGAVGISQGLIYHYFASKEAIHAELIGSAFARINAAALSLEQLDGTARDRIARALEGLLREVEENEEFAQYVLLIAQAGVAEGLPETTRALIRQRQDVPYEVMTRIFVAGQREGTVRDHPAADLAVLFWSMVRGLALYRASRGRVFERPGAALLEAVFLRDAE
jgi:TetR/AcrR family transcriptional regulator